MSRASNETRKLFLKLHAKGQKPIQIANLLEVTRQTITAWIRKLKTQPEESLFIIRRSKGKPTKIDMIALKEEFENNKLSFNREIASKFNISKSMVQSLRAKMGYTRKVVRTTYKEASKELKKTLQTRLLK
jgi:uncharacterized protein YjcR